MAHSIAILIPYFGPWPAWMNFFVESCRANRTIDWILFSDSDPPENRARNVRHIKTTFDEYRRLVSDALEIRIGAEVPYKLCDVRPALPLVHSSQSASSTRFTSEQERLERSVDLMYRCLERIERGESYDDLLDPGVAPREKVDLRVYVSLGTVILWAGKRPRLLRRFLSRARLAPDMRTLTSLVWTAWAFLSPGSLRTFLLMLVGIRNRLASETPASTDAVPWPRPAASVSSPVAGTAPVQGAPRA